MRKRPKLCSWPYSCRAVWVPIVISDTEVYCRRHGYKIADAVTSQVVRERDGECVYCGSPGPLDAAHVLVRGNHYARYSLEGLVALCREHHEHFGGHPNEWRDFIDWRYPGVWTRLVHAEIDGERYGGTVDLAEVITDMRAQLGRVG